MKNGKGNKRIPKVIFNMKREKLKNKSLDSDVISALFGNQDRGFDDIKTPPTEPPPICTPT